MRKQIFAWTAPTRFYPSDTPYVQLFEHEDGIQLVIRDTRGIVSDVVIRPEIAKELAEALVK